MRSSFRFITTFLIAGLAASAGAKSYQVTGTVSEISDSKIVVQQAHAGGNNEEYQIARDASSKTTGDIAVGSKVTVEYKMTAVSIDLKSAPATPTPATAAPTPATKSAARPAKTSAASAKKS